MNKKRKFILLLIAFIISGAINLVFSQIVDKKIEGDNKNRFHPHPYLYDPDSVFSYNDLTKLYEKLKSEIPLPLFDKFRNETMIVSIKINSKGNVDSLSVLISSSSSEVDSIICYTIYSYKFRYPQSLLKERDYIYFSIPIIKKHIVGRRKKLWEFLPFFK